MLLEKEVVKDIMSWKVYVNANVKVRTNKESKRIFKQYFDDFDTSIYYKDYAQDVKINYTPLFHNLYTDIVQKRLYNEVKVYATDSMTKQSMVMKRRIIEDGSNHHDSVRLAQANRRFGILAGFAICGLIPGTSAQMFKDSHANKDRVYRVEHEDIYTFLRQHAEFSGDFQEDYRTALTVLWLKYPYDLTGFDDVLRAMYLEEMLLGV